MRFGILDERRIMPFDADDRENDDGRGLFRCVNAAKAHDAPLVRKLDNGAHLAAQPLSAPCPAADTPLTRCTRIGAVSKPHAGLTLR